jgi:hypothetical protein
MTMMVVSLARHSLPFTLMISECQPSGILSVVVRESPRYREDPDTG